MFTNSKAWIQKEMKSSPLPSCYSQESGGGFVFEFIISYRNTHTTPFSTPRNTAALSNLCPFRTESSPASRSECDQFTKPFAERVGIGQSSSWSAVLLGVLFQPWDQSIRVGVKPTPVWKISDAGSQKNFSEHCSS